MATVKRDKANAKKAKDARKAAMAKAKSSINENKSKTTVVAAFAKLKAM